MDELAEFDRDALEALRGPLEDGRVAIARVGRAVVLPSRFQLVAAMNPCPCGHAGDDTVPCRCPRAVAGRYAARISGPLRDRIDLWVAMPRIAPAELVRGPAPEGSAAVAERIATARRLQLARSGRLNCRLSGRALRAACRLGPTAEARAIAIADARDLSARGTERLLRVARTIADLGGAERVACEDLDEASRYRQPGGLDLRQGAA